MPDDLNAPVTAGERSRAVVDAGYFDVPGCDAIAEVDARTMLIVDSLCIERRKVAVLRQALEDEAMPRIDDRCARRECARVLTETAPEGEP